VEYLKFGAHGPLSAILTRRFHGGLNASMNSFRGVGTLQIIAARGGQVLATEDFAANGKRMILS
jgi:hypothetical protein